MPYTKGFEKLERNVKKEYLGEKVPTKYKERYGKRYDAREVKSVAFAIAKSRGVKIH